MCVCVCDYLNVLVCVMYVILCMFMSQCHLQSDHEENEGTRLVCRSVTIIKIPRPEACAGHY